MIQCLGASPGTSKAANRPHLDFSKWGFIVWGFVNFGSERRCRIRRIESIKDRHSSTDNIPLPTYKN
jgi:hypothetical protein